MIVPKKKLELVVKLALEGYSKKIEKIILEELEKGAVYLYTDLTRRILQQKYNHKPLSETWLKKKRALGWDERILIATRAYLESINVFEVLDGSRLIGYRVAPKEGIHPPSGLTFQLLSKVHEFGSKKAKVPARPHWRPVWREFQTGKQKALVKAIFARVKALQKKGKK